ncbi:MAG: MGMT family protein [Candidatus Gracilibacteria bacterium]|nr:MGMT family protein [Candidatus Gracilibacteria bacterium]
MQTKTIQILSFLQTIPKGKVSTYKLIAERFQVHPRAVAQVMRYNKDPITYPCYKVIAHSGKISGYNTERGVDEKIEKLEKDGIEIINGKINKKYYFI